MQFPKLTLKCHNIDLKTLAKIEKLIKGCGGEVVATAEGDDPPPQDPGGGDPPK